MHWIYYTCNRDRMKFTHACMKIIARNQFNLRQSDLVISSNEHMQTHWMIGWEESMILIRTYINSICFL